MSTVFQRVSYHCKQKKMPLWPQKDLIEVGKLVAAAYRSQNKELPVKRVIVREPNGKFNVQWYPTEFIPEIDRVIREYKVTTNANISMKADVPRFTIETMPKSVDGRKKRQRIPINRKPVKIT